MLVHTPGVRFGGAATVAAEREAISTAGAIAALIHMSHAPYVQCAMASLLIRLICLPHDQNLPVQHPAVPAFEARHVDAGRGGPAVSQAFPGPPHVDGAAAEVENLGLFHVGPEIDPVIGAVR